MKYLTFNVYDMIRCWKGENEMELHVKEMVNTTPTKHICELCVGGFVRMDIDIFDE